MYLYVCISTCTLRMYFMWYLAGGRAPYRGTTLISIYAFEHGSSHYSSHGVPLMSRDKDTYQNSCSQGSEDTERESEGRESSN